MAESIKKPFETPPYLKKVQVRDYPPLRNATVAFKRGLNIIIGNNGAGKTRFLTLANDLADLHEHKEHFLGSRCRVVFGGVFGGEEETVVEFEDESQDNFGIDPLNVVVRTPEKVMNTAPDNYVDFLWEANAVNNFLALYSPVLIRHGVPATGLPVLDESAELTLEKRSVTVQLKGGVKRVNELNGQFVQVALRSIVALIRNGFTVLRGIPVPPMTADEVRHQIVRLMAAYTDRLTYYLPLYSPVQAVRCSEYFQVYHQELQDQYTVKGLVFEYRINNEWISFGMLSDGTKRLVYTVAEMLAPYEVGLNKTTNEIGVYDRRKIIFLEEPELGIHPKQLTKLLNLIREVSKENQVIMTTHSPQVLDMLTEKELDRITVCTLDPKKGTQFHKLSAAKQKDAREYLKTTGFLSDYWRYSYLEETDAE